MKGNPKCPSTVHYLVRVGIFVLAMSVIVGTVMLRAGGNTP